MIRDGMIAFALSIILVGCTGQTKQEFTEIKRDSIQPKTDIKVNKEYDEKGNLIRYDSSYSYYYSNIENDSLLGDSIFSDFQNYFNKR